MNDTTNIQKYEKFLEPAHLENQMKDTAQEQKLLQL